MENTSFMRVEEVAQELCISKSYAYKIVQKLNEELKNKGSSRFRDESTSNILWNAPATVLFRKRGKNVRL